MRAILINPYQRTITEVVDPDLQADTRRQYRAIYRHLTEPGIHAVDLFSIIQIEEAESMFVDDEGLMGAGHHCFQIWGRGAPIAGRALIMGFDHRGDNASSRMTIDAVEKTVTFMNSETTGELAPFRRAYIDHPRLGRILSYIGGRPVLRPIKGESK